VTFMLAFYTRAFRAHGRPLRARSLEERLSL
jgi:hypothetical protein